MSTSLLEDIYYSFVENIYDPLDALVNDKKKLQCIECNTIYYQESHLSALYPLCSEKCWRSYYKNRKLN